jgi:glycerol-3-phosphate dehydrogenase
VSVKSNLEKLDQRLWQACTMPRFDRSSSLEALKNKTFDLLVIGGGMTGTGVAVDAVTRGLGVALIEKDDFASGTSSKSSKMVHGGLRYLQQREFGLVYENLHERQRLLTNAPHLISPLPFLIPLFGKDGVVSKAVARSYRTALVLYDATGGVRIGKRHKEITRDEVVAHFPSLNVSHLVAGFLYYDARGDDARVALTLARTAADHGAVVANYTKASGFLHDSTGRVTGATVTQNAPGEKGTPFDVNARVVVNAAGVFADEVSWLEEGVVAETISPAKGVHLSVRADRLPCDIAAVIPVPKDKRSIFVVPWEDSPYVYLGTTDTAYEGSLDDPRCNADDVAYILNAVNALTSAELTVDDVTGVWAGLRPLIKAQAGKKVSARTADLSRRHKVETSPEGVVLITGGKWTTYRVMAEDVLSACKEARLLATLPACSTQQARMVGAPLAQSPVTSLSLPPGLHSYGAEQTLVQSLPGADRWISPGLSEAMVRFALRYEYALTVEDVLARRSRLLFLDAQQAAAVSGQVAALITEELGQDGHEADFLQICTHFSLVP